MKNLKLLLLLLPINVFAQSISVVNLYTNDIAFNPFDNKIYATAPSLAGIYGNCLCIIDPVTAQIDTAIFVGSEPNKIAISIDGKTIFVSLDGSAAVRQFSVPTLTSGPQYSLGIDSWSGPYYAEDLDILKRNDTSFAVSRRNIGYSPKHEGVAVYDDGIMRPNTTQDHTGSNVIEIINDSLMVGYNNETTEFGLRTIRINNNGVTELGVFQNMFSGFYIDIYYSNERIYSTNGKVVDISTGAPFLLGSFYEAQGPVVEDLSMNLVCYAYQDYSDDDVLIKRYSRNTFVISDTIAVDYPVTIGAVQSLITWGSFGKYAYNTDEGKVVIISSSGTDISENLQNVNLFPNPTSDYVTLFGEINGPAVIKLISLTGQIVTEETIYSFPHTLDISQFPSGTYILHIQSEKSSGAYKIMKQ